MTDTSFERPKAESEASLPRLRSVAASMLAGVRHVLAVRRDRRLLQALPDSVLKDTVAKCCPTRTPRISSW